MTHRAAGWWAFAVLAAVYAATLAPTVTWWDSGELIAAAHSLGIPHPPGTALYVLAANVWATLTWPLDYAVRVNLLSAVSSAAAAGLIGSMLGRWTRDPLAGFAAAICAGAAASVWRNANEAEVYALALLASAVILWSADRAGAGARDRWKWVLLFAYACGVAYSLHLAALVAVPAALILMWPARRELNTARVVQVIALTALGTSVVLYLIVRARHDPWVNQGNPATWSAFLDVLNRNQYTNPGLWPRQAPLYLQVGNWFEYADWQFALGLHPSPPPSPARTSVTLLFVAFGLYGSAVHRTLHRRSWSAFGVLFATASLGVVLYLNLKAGPSYGDGVLPDGTPREARERDYFFAMSFAVWGVWAGFGALRIARAFGDRLTATRPRRTGLPGAGVLIAAMPIALNWGAVDRRSAADATAARDSAHSLLRAVPPYGVLLAAGDNDSYPLWYAQRVENYRADVAVVTIPLLGATWYRQELERRHSLVSPAAADTWRGLTASIADVCRHARNAGRAIVMAPRAHTHKLAPECLERAKR